MGVKLVSLIKQKFQNFKSILTDSPALDRAAGNK
jgi:hypothetical protein